MDKVSEHLEDRDIDVTIILNCLLRKEVLMKYVGWAELDQNQLNLWDLRFD
jgi:hypothetical protein